MFGLVKRGNRSLGSKELSRYYRESSPSLTTWLYLLHCIHDVFHVSNLYRYIPDPRHVIQYELMQLKENMVYVEEPVQIWEIMEQAVWNRIILYVKVLWKHHQTADATWEPKWVM